MIRAKSKRVARGKKSRDRDGYDTPLLIYLSKGQRPALRKRYGPRSEAKIIRKLVAEHLSFSAAAPRKA